MIEKKTKHRKGLVQMTKFIRLDRKGEWKGKEHRSSFAGTAITTADTKWEDGVSCFELGAKALDQLHSYWAGEVGLNISEFGDLQITIFEGEKVGREGAEGEFLAGCEKTVIETEAKPVMEEVFELQDELYFEEISEEEYYNELQHIIKGVIA